MKTALQLNAFLADYSGLHDADVTSLILGVTSRSLVIECRAEHAESEAWKSLVLRFVDVRDIAMSSKPSSHALSDYDFPCNAEIDELVIESSLMASAQLKGMYGWQCSWRFEAATYHVLDDRAAD